MITPGSKVCELYAQKYGNTMSKKYGNAISQKCGNTMSEKCGNAISQKLENSGFKKNQDAIQFKVKSTLKENASAIKIQSLWRDYKARNFEKAVQISNNLKAKAKAEIETHAKQVLEDLRLNNKYKFKNRVKRFFAHLNPFKRSRIQQPKAKVVNDKLLSNRIIAPNKRIPNGFELCPIIISHQDAKNFKRIIVDFNNDKTLKRIMQETRELLAKHKELSDKEKLILIMRKTAVIFSKVGEKRVFDKRIDLVSNRLLGDQIEMGAGVCRHRALLTKILADDAGINVGLQWGDSLKGAHIWNTFIRLFVKMNG